MLDIGLSEALSKIVTGRQATTPHNNLLYKNISTNPMSSWPQNRSADESKSFADMSKDANAASGYTGAKPTDLNTPGKSSGSGSSNAGVISAIGRGWEDSEDVLSDTRKSLNSSKNYISNLGRVRDQYLTSIDNYKKRTDEAIAGNKTLIEKNQKEELDNLAGDTKTTMDKTNVMLGAASNGSAGRAFARKIATDAGKERAKVLTARGDQTSYQNQAAANAVEEYNTKREQAYEWEKTAKEQALAEFKAQERALERLKNKASGWKDSDIKAESDKNLNNFMGSLNAIMVQAKGFRDNLSAKMTEYGGLADELDVASIGVDAPAELDTPEFTENIDFTDPNNTADYYDPNAGKGKVIKGYDALGNPIYDETATVDPATVTA